MTELPEKQRCPKPTIEWLGSHTMKLVKNDSQGREVWQCASCGFTEIAPVPGRETRNGVAEG